MKESNELFKLCKQVYEATGWDYVESYINESEDYVNPSSNIIDPVIHAPLYTSDYLLEKLSAITDHISVQQSNRISIDASNDEKSNWYAHYWLRSRRVQVKSDTPLKALLKLTLKLHRENIL